MREERDREDDSEKRKRNKPPGTSQTKNLPLLQWISTVATESNTVVTDA